MIFQVTMTVKTAQGESTIDVQDAIRFALQHFAQDPELTVITLTVGNGLHQVPDPELNGLRIEPHAVMPGAEVCVLYRNGRRILCLYPAGQPTPRVIYEGDIFPSGIEVLRRGENSGKPIFDRQKRTR